MAYLRKEKETVEIDYSLNRVWTAISKVLANLEWTTEQIDDTAHHAKAKTKPSFMTWGSVVLIDAAPVDKNTTRVSVAAESPVTTITAIVYFGQARHQINIFFRALEKELAK